MATVPKKEKGLNKYSFRGLTPDQVNELTQEQVVELYRARIRRRFSRSNSSSKQRSSINTSDSMPSARSLKRTLSPDRSLFPSRHTSGTLSWCPRWWVTMWQSTTASHSTTLRSNSIWLVATLESSLSPTSPLDTVRPVWVLLRDLLIPLLNDLYLFRKAITFTFSILTFGVSFQILELIYINIYNQWESCWDLLPSHKSPEGRPLSTGLKCRSKSSRAGGLDSTLSLASHPPRFTSLSCPTSSLTTIVRWLTPPRYTHKHVANWLRLLEEQDHH